MDTPTAPPGEPSDSPDTSTTSGAAVTGDTAVTAGTLVVAGTPLGNPRDASTRLRQELAGADVIAAEDTRRLRRLCIDLAVAPTGRVVSYHEHNETERTPTLVADLLAGQRVVMVTDAGMPSVSDPGYRLVTAAVAAGAPVTCAPGPSAVTAALAVSGLATDRYCVEGFLPRQPGRRRRVAAALASEPRTLVLFEAPHRLAAALADLAEAFGADRPAVLCRELTKTHEQIIRGTLGELAAHAAAERLRGEITLVVAGAPVVRRSAAQALAHVQELVAGGVRLKDACRAAASDSEVSSRELYDLALKDPEGHRTAWGQRSPHDVTCAAYDRGRHPLGKDGLAMTDPGPVPFVFDIERATLDNATFRTTAWSGRYLQVTLMTIEPGDDIGLEMHADVDQFLRVEAGAGRVSMGPAADDLNQHWEISDDWAILVPAGTWHNVWNTGPYPLKVYSIYGPPNHPPGTINVTRADAEAYEREHHH